MAAARVPKHVKYRQTSPPRVGHYEVYYKDHAVGQVAKFQFGAGQFGARWMATTPRGRKSGQYPTRDRAAAWLVEADSASDRS